MKCNIDKLSAADRVLNILVVFQPINYREKIRA